MKMIILSSLLFLAGMFGVALYAADGCDSCGDICECPDCTSEACECSLAEKHDACDQITVVPGYINGIPSEEFFKTFKSAPINYKVFNKAFNDAGGKVYAALRLLDPSLYKEVTLTVQGKNFKALVWWLERQSGEVIWMITRY